MIEFWATWCRFCRHDEQPLESLLHTVDNGRFTLIAVNVNGPREAVRRYLARFPRTCKIVLTEDTDLVAAYMPVSLPVYVLIDHSGNIRAVRRGALTGQAFKSLLTTIDEDLQQSSLGAARND